MCAALCSGHPLQMRCPHCWLVSFHACAAHREEQLHSPSPTNPWAFKTHMHALHFAAWVNNARAARQILEAAPQVGFADCFLT